MAKQIKIEFISSGFKEILKSQGVHSLVEDEANMMCDRANSYLNEESEGFKADSFYGGFGGGRWVGTVSTTDLASMRAEAEDKALSKAVR